MTCYIALLRGVNVGGNNIIKMSNLKASLEQQGFQNVTTYINSGNAIFNSDQDEVAVKSLCEKLIADDFSLDIPVCVISAADLADALAHAPEWWAASADQKHDAFFVIPPMTAEEICEHVGAVKDEYEKVAYHNRVIFWSAPVETFSRTRWSKIVRDKSMYRAITVRNANTTVKLAEFAKEREQLWLGKHSTKS